MTGYVEHKDQVLKRRRRVEGQVRGLQRMVEADTYCIDVLTQVSAATKALQAVALELLEDHLAHCVTDATREGGPTADAKSRKPPRPSPASSAPSRHLRHLRRVATFIPRLEGTFAMSTAIYTVTGMTCGHCVAAVTRELRRLEGVSAVEVDLNAGGASRMRVTSAAPLLETAVRGAVDEAGYDLAGASG